MKPDKLLDSIGNIDDDIINEAENENICGKAEKCKKRKIVKFPHRLVALAACLLLVVVGTFVLWPKDSDKNMNEGDNVSNVVNNNSNAYVAGVKNVEGIHVIALSANSQGIDTNTVFQVTSKEELSEEYIKANFKLSPVSDFTVEKISNISAIKNYEQLKEKANFAYNIVPSNSLESDKVYTIKFEDGEMKYSWAFQTKKEFRVENAYPANKSNKVDVKSGIEVTFSMVGVENIDKYFKIEPQVDGKFDYNNNIVTFIPKNLDYATAYTVTISKDLSLPNSEMTLGEDYVFSFTTASEYGDSIELITPVTHMTPQNEKVLLGYYMDFIYERENNNKKKDETLTVKVYEYKNLEDYKNALTGYYKNNNVFREDNVYKNKTDNIATLNQKIALVDEYSDIFLINLPKDLKEGYYLVEVMSDLTKEKKYHLVQVNDKTMYSAVFEDKIMVTAFESSKDSFAANKEVYLNDKLVGKTNADGFINFDASKDDYLEKDVFLTIKDNGKKDFVYYVAYYNRGGDFVPYRDYGYHYYWDDYSQIQGKYDRYMYTDRGTYLPTDTINVFGYLKNKEGKKTEKVKVQLVEDWTDIVIESKEVELSQIGSFTTNFNFRELTGTSYSVKVFVGEDVIISKYIQVEKYTKPLYKITGELSKNVVFSGEEVIYKLGAIMYDGNPMKNVTLELQESTDSHSDNRTINLDEQGYGNKKINTNVTGYDNGWRPVRVWLYTCNSGAEDVRVFRNDSFEVFPKRTMLEAENSQDTKGKVDVMLHKINLDNYTDSYNYEELRGEALSGSVAVSIEERYYEKVLVEEKYDYINKETVNEYRYNEVVNNVFNGTINIVDGKGSINIPNYDKSKSYTLTLTYTNNGETVVEKHHYYGYMTQEEGYSLVLEELEEKAEKGYSSGDELNFRLNYNGEVVNKPSDKIIVYFLRNGLVEYKVFDEGQFSIEYLEKYKPYVYYKVVYYNDGVLRVVGDDRGNNILNQNIEELTLNIEVETDKEIYKPGEEVTAKIKVTDYKGNPAVSDVNISVCDESYFDIYEQDVDIIRTIVNNLRKTDGVLADNLSNNIANLLAAGMNSAMKDMATAPEAENAVGKNERATDEYEVRDEFVDNGLFRTVTTDSKGTATVTFNLPDNLTTWRITTQGVNEKSFAGNTENTVVTNMDFYLSAILKNEYLAGDNVGISLRSFGNSIKQGDSVSYKVKVESSEGKVVHETELNSTVGAYGNINLGKLEQGNYSVTVYGDCGEYKDAIKLQFSVKDTLIYFQNTKTYKLSDSTVLDKVYSNAVISLSNKSESDFYKSMMYMLKDGKRLDQTAIALVAQKFLADNFDVEYYKVDEADLTNMILGYLSDEGGLKLFEQGNADVEATAKLVNVLDDPSELKNLRMYLKNILEVGEFSSDIPKALWGLSKFGDPVLLTTYELLENDKISVEDKIYLALTLANFGDISNAKAVYQEIINGKLAEKDGYLYYDETSDNTTSYRLTALLSTLGLKVGDVGNSDKMFRYLVNNPSKYELSNFEQMLYIKDRNIMELEEIKNLMGEVTVDINGEKTTYKVNSFGFEFFSAKMDDVEKIKFSNIRGDLEARVIALGGVNDLQSNKTEDFGIKVVYENLNGSMDSIKQGDTIKVQFIPSKNAKLEESCYNITYIIPAGFRYMGNYYQDSDWARENGQKLNLYTWYDKDKDIFESRTIYIKAVQTGEYIADYTVIKSMVDDMLNYHEQGVLTVK